MMESNSILIGDINNSSPAYEEVENNSGLANQSIPVAMTYDDVFPGLPETAVNSSSDQTIGKWNNKLRVGSRNVTQVRLYHYTKYYCDFNIFFSLKVFHIPHEERRFDSSNKFGEGDLLKTCADIMQSTGATIETSYAKDQSLTFVVIGNDDLIIFITKIRF